MPHPDPEPDSRTHARDLLRAHNRTVTQIVRVETDHVLYLGGAQCAMTAWLYQQDGQTRVFTEPGFPAYPTVSLPHTPPAPPKAATETEPPDPSLYAD